MEEKTKPGFKICIIGPEGSGKTAICKKLENPGSSFNPHEESTIGVNFYPIASQLNMGENTKVWEVGQGRRFEPIAEPAMKDADVFLITVDANTFNVDANTFNEDQAGAEKVLKKYKEWAEKFASPNTQIQLVVTKTDGKDLEQLEKNVSTVAKQVGLDNNPILYASKNNIEMIETVLAETVLAKETSEKTDLLIRKSNELISSMESGIKFAEEGKPYTPDKILQGKKDLEDSEGVRRNLVRELGKLDAIISKDFQAVLEKDEVKQRYFDLEKINLQHKLVILEGEILDRAFTSKISNEARVNEMEKVIAEEREAVKKMFEEVGLGERKFTPEEQASITADFEKGLEELKATYQEKINQFNQSITQIRSTDPTKIGQQKVVEFIETEKNKLLEEVDPRQEEAYTKTISAALDFRKEEDKRELEFRSNHPLAQEHKQLFEEKERLDKVKPKFSKVIEGKEQELKLRLQQDAYIREIRARIEQFEDHADDFLGRVAIDPTAFDTRDTIQKVAKTLTKQLKICEAKESVDDRKVEIEIFKTILGNEMNQHSEALSSHREPWELLKNLKNWLDLKLKEISGSRFSIFSATSGKLLQRISEAAGPASQQESPGGPGEGSHP